MDPPAAHRKRLHRRENPFDSRFITFSTFHRLPLLNHPAIMDDLAARLTHARRTHGMLLYAWVIMPEHVHVLIRAAAAPWSTIASSFKTQSSRHALAHLRTTNSPILREIQVLDDGELRDRFWQHGGGFDRNIRDLAEFTETVRYIHCNPVERGLVPEPRQWRWSSIRWWDAQREGEIECDPPPGDPRTWQSWKGYV